jgi:hypothetical protein
VWFRTLVTAGILVKVPEIADYEVRRELIRSNKTKSIARLDTLKGRLEYLPLSTAAMLQAAAFWAQARQQGLPTAHDKALDGDVILAAQARLEASQGHDVVVATDNIRHVSLFVRAQQWDTITA